MPSSTQSVRIANPVGIYRVNFIELEVGLPCCMSDRVTVPLRVERAAGHVADSQREARQREELRVVEGLSGACPDG
ncbi:hypothetical protein GCM10027160_37430 [Streptomyces calidiresistens]